MTMFPTSVPAVVSGRRHRPIDGLGSTPQMDMGFPHWAVFSNSQIRTSDPSVAWPAERRGASSVYQYFTNQGDPVALRRATMHLSAPSAQQEGSHLSVSLQAYASRNTAHPKYDATGQGKVVLAAHDQDRSGSRYYCPLSTEVHPYFGCERES